MFYSECLARDSRDTGQQFDGLGENEGNSSHAERETSTQDIFMWCVVGCNYIPHPQLLGAWSVAAMLMQHLLFCLLDCHWRLIK